MRREPEELPRSGGGGGAPPNGSGGAAGEGGEGGCRYRSARYADEIEAGLSRPLLENAPHLCLILY